MLDPIRWLRLLTGNADPPGTAYVAVSDSTSGVTWKKVPADALAPGVAVASLGYTPVNKAGDTGVGTLGVAALTASGNIISTAGSIAAAGNVSATGNITTGTGTIQGAQVSATVQVSAPSANITANLTAASATVNGTLSTLAISATSISATSTISTQGSISAQGNVSASGNITANTGTVQGSVVQALSSMNVAGQTVWTAAHFPQPTATPGPNRVPMSDGAGKLDAWITPTGGGGGTVTPIPPGLIAFAANAGSIPTGWTRLTAANGRYIVIAGNSGVPGNQTFPDGGAAGTNDWSHRHSVPGQSFTASFSGSATGGAEDNTGGPSSTGSGGGTGATFADGSHTHSLSGVGFGASGSASGTGTALDSAATTWLPPAYALVLIRKD
jgi:hypothetical protein